jgi:hypothetical protein
LSNFFRIGSAGLNWSNVGSWSATSGGSSNGSAQPTSTDNVTFDSNSPASVTVTTAANTNTLTLNKLSLVITLNGAGITCAGLLTSSSANTCTINKTASETVTLQNGATSSGISGTSKLVITGGTWQRNGGTGNSINVDLQGNVTLAVGTGISGGTVTYVSGTITATGSTLTIGGACTLNTNGMTWNNIVVGGNITLTSNLSMSGLLSFNTSVVYTINKTTSETITIAGGITTGAGTGSAGGTAKYILTGGTWTGQVATNSLIANLDIQGNVTIATNVYYGTGTLTWVSGTVTVTSSTLNLTDSCTLNTNGMTWNTVSTTATSGKTYTLNSLLSASTITIQGSTVTFSGTSGFSTTTLSCPSTNAQTITLAASITYTITSNFTCNSSQVGGIVAFVSSTPGTQYKINLTNPGTCNVLANFTDADASGGRSITTFNGTISNCNNVVSYPDYVTIAV